MIIYLAQMNQMCRYTIINICLHPHTIRRIIKDAMQFQGHAMFSIFLQKHAQTFYLLLQHLREGQEQERNKSYETHWRKFFIFAFILKSD